MLHSVILAGGSGTRFWPQSRRSLPKQFLRFGGERTLLQETVDRCQPIIPTERTWIVTGKSHAEESARQLPELAQSRLLIEPCARNTAAAIALAAIRLLAQDPDAVMLVMPADHVIRPIAEFHKTAQKAISWLDRHPDALVLFGAKPTYPSTGFGYIQQGETLSEELSVQKVASFREKPDVMTATSYLDSGNFLWNCGLFVWRADTILSQLEKHAPDFSASLKTLAMSANSDGWDQTLATEFPRMPSISIDYAVLEKATTVCVVPASFDWDDVGSWPALSRLLPADENGNVSDGTFCGIKTEGSIIRTSSDHLVATFGVRDLIIVHTSTATLVADKHDESALRALIAELERRGLTEFL